MSPFSFWSYCSQSALLVGLLEVLQGKLRLTLTCVVVCSLGNPHQTQTTSLNIPRDQLRTILQDTLQHDVIAVSVVRDETAVYQTAGRVAVGPGQLRDHDPVRGQRRQSEIDHEFAQGRPQNGPVRGVPRVQGVRGQPQ